MSERQSKPYRTKISWHIRLMAYLGSWVAWAVMHLLFFSCRKEVFGKELWDRIAKENGGKVLGGGWHRGAFFIIYHFRNLKGAIISSRSRDGEFITQILNRFGYLAPRGSSTHGGKEALLETVDFVNEGNAAGIAVDAPKGPPYISKHGIITIAQRTGAPVVPFCWYAEPNIRADSWDRTIMPKPFARLVAAYDRKPMIIPGDATREQLEEYRKEFDRRLNILMYQTDHWFENRGKYADPRDIPVPEPVPIPVHPPRKKKT
jgi:lysophospholipid acyltransferase (LPLAT)-like uncharacterized protein